MRDRQLPRSKHMARDRMEILKKAFMHVDETEARSFRSALCIKVYIRMTLSLGLTEKETIPCPYFLCMETTYFCQVWNINFPFGNGIRIVLLSLISLLLEFP